MEIFKRNKYVIQGFIGGMAGTLLLSAGVALAASSFTYATFQKLIGGVYVTPVTTAYSYATQIQQPVVTSTASTTGSLSGGSLVTEVVATTPTGTSTPSLEIATTTSVNEGLLLKWAPVPGATGYAVYIGTSTPGSEQSYFTATSTSGAANTQYTLTSTSSPTYSALAASGSGFYAAMGSASSSIMTSGLIQSSTNATTTCTTALAGAMFYSTVNAHLWLCTSGAWALIK
jgi:hypothetical protein